MSKEIARRINLVFLLLGMGLLAGLLWRMDLSQVGQQLLRIGPLFLLALASYVLAVLASSAAWWCMTDPESTRAGFRPFIIALWAGHAINTVTPGAALGEVFKGTMMKDRIDPPELVASLVSFNFLSTLVTGLFTLLGPLAALVLLDLPGPVLWSLLFAAGLALMPALLMLLLLRIGAAHRAVRLAARLPGLRNRLRHPEALLAKAEAIDQRIRRFPKRRPKRFALALLCLVGVRLMQVAEVWVLLCALMPDKGPGWLLLLAMVTQSASQLIAWVMTFIPSQVGVAESGSALLFRLLGMDPLLGLSMEVARRVRKLLGTAIGLSLAWLYMPKPKDALNPETPIQSAGN